MKDKFKGMSRKALLEYVWDYYKLHIIAAVVAAAVIGSLINTIFINPAPKDYVGVIVYGEWVEPDSLERLGRLLEDEVVPDELKPGYTAMTDNIYASGNSQMDMALSQRFAALVMLGEADILIMPRSEFGVMAEAGNFAKLSPEQESMYEGRLVTSGEVSAVDISDSPALKACGAELNEPIAGIAVGSARQEAAAKALAVLAGGGSL